MLMNKLAQQVNKADLHQQKDVWIALNKGTLARLAEEFGFSTAYITDIFRHKRNSKGGVVEARLRELGAPGFAAE
jgi:hypothetical protein